MSRPDYVPPVAWRWLNGEVVDLADYAGVHAAAGGLVAPEMAPSWRAWAKQVDTDLGWHLLCGFLALLPATYRPENVDKAERLRAEWADLDCDMQWLAQRAADINRRALELGFVDPLPAAALAALDQLAEQIHDAALRPVRAEVDYLDAERASAQTFVQHFDALWANRKHVRELWRVQMSHEDVARIGAATGLAQCTADAVRHARARKPTPTDPHDPARGVFVLRNTRNNDPDK